MKILILNGSPKRDASDTMHLSLAFTDGMNEVQKNVIHSRSDGAFPLRRYGEVRCRAESRGL